ncbi:MAG: S41 family peptidase [Rhizomicrobium sp.]
MTLSRNVLGGAVALLAVLALTFGGRAVAASATLSAADRLAAVRAIEDKIGKTYVFAERRAPIVARLEQALAAHRYDVADPDVFAQRITEDLQAVSHDGHLYFDSDPGEYAASLAPPKSDKGLGAYYRAVSLREHSGLTRLDILPGNIRYLKLTAFHWTPRVTAAAYDDAARFLKDGDAVIFDLRENGGGDSDAADYFSKAFVRPGHKQYYVLVDGHVASAAEAVAYGLQQEHAATIVGSTTYGAANNNRKFPIAPCFILSVSYHRPVNPISGTNWEGVGVKPDIAVPASQALDAAMLAALDKLGAAPNLKPETRAEYRWARIGVEARLHPVTIARAPLQALAGTYGTITLRLTDDGLRLDRADRPRWQQDLLLTPMTADGVFGVESFDDLRVRLTGSTLELLHGSEAEREVFPRDAASGAAASP